MCADINTSALLLTGMMGTGKTTVGTLLAEALQRRLIDLDAVISERAGVSVEAIFRTFGEQQFRYWEHEALRDVLTAPASRSVVALGGGAVLSAANRDLMAGRLVIWLDADLQALAFRLAGSERPLLIERSVDAIQRIANERRALYAAVSQFRIDTTDLDPAAVTAAILEWLAERWPSSRLLGGSGGPF
jgi:shikimate kinase